MNYQIFQILTAHEVERITADLPRERFVDGKATAHGPARNVKNNLQTERAGPELSDTDRMVVDAFQRNPDFVSFSLPRRMTYPLFSRYEATMEYGMHVDQAIMGAQSGERVRGDLACTLFLSPPQTYDGGELVLSLPMGEQEIKLEAGEAIVYTVGSLHRVAPVTRGVRLACIEWIQSMVRDEGLRSILADLAQASIQAQPDPALSSLISKSYQNLLRYAAEP